ncbi:MAG: cation:proton antiporter [Puniceicoccales bacterium]|jgi:CPA2 family monovalent cation:H+ antiporter-2|nr:cation:proton antiporter [Puniceicoccales bacterium]
MELHLLRDLAIVLFACGIFAIIFHYLRLPLLLGYIVAGFLVGPNFHLIPSVYDTNIINHLSELGVIFLMFFIGLEFDLLKLKKLFIPSLTALVSQTVGMILIGIMVAPMFHWSGLNGLFLGALLSMGSTMITIPILKEQNALRTDFAQCAIGRLIMEDMLAILMIVILSGIALTGHFAWDTAWDKTFLLGVFVVMVFCVGKFVAPWFVKTLFGSESPEILIVVIVGTMLAVCVLAQRFELSVALGSFLVGSILSQTSIADDVETLTAPLRNIFGAVFFASIGIMTNLNSVLNHGLLVIGLSIITIVGQTFFGSAGLFLSGQRAETAFRAAFCQSQIGEFSFIIAALGNSLGVVDRDFVSVTSGVAIGTILLSSMLNRRATQIFKFLEAHCPDFLKEIGVFYHNILSSADNRLSKSDLIAIVTKPALKGILWFFLLSGTLVSVSTLAKFTHTGKFNHIFQLNIIQSAIWGCAFLLCLPFLIGLTKNLNDILFGILGNLTSNHIRNEKVQSRAFGIFRYITSLVVLFFFSGAFLGIAAKYLPSGTSILTFGLAILAIGTLLWRKLLIFNNKLEHAFIANFNYKVETREQKQRALILRQTTEKYPWPVVINEVILRPGYDVVGSRIADTTLRPRAGATIIAITRCGYTDYNPQPETMLFPGDRLILLGEQSQINLAKDILETESAQKNLKKTEFNLAQVCIGNHEDFVGKALGEAKLRKTYGVSVVGIQRSAEKIVDISAETELQQNDILLLTGNERDIQRLKTKIEMVNPE